MKTVALLALLFSLSAFAQIAPNPPVITKVPGQPVKAAWPGGDEAELRFSRSKIIKPALNMQVMENLCSPQLGGTVKMLVPVRIDKLAWFWTKHLDPAKVEQIVLYQIGNFSSPISVDETVTNSHKFGPYSALVLNLPPDELHFPDAAWLASLTIDSWMSELMLTNNQTGIKENRIVGGAYGVRLRKTGNLFAVIDRIESFFYSAYYGSDFVLFGQAIQWLVNNKQGSCQVTLKPDLEGFEVEVSKFSQTLHDPFQPYLFKQDVLFDAAGSYFFHEELNYADH